MSIAPQDRLGFLLQFIKKSRKQLYTSTLIASIISVCIFLAGSYFFLFHYYEELNRNYYYSILKSVYAFQKDLISKGTYREDMRNAAQSVKGNRGIVSVWFTDRHGRLIYHTDKAIFEEYRSKRLPSEYYQSIEDLWRFQEGYPVMKVVPLQKWTLLRLSLPLYSYGREDYDFIMGLDVKRFLLIPDQLKILLPVSIGYIILSILLFFLPLFFLIRRRCDDLESQAKVFIGSMQFQRQAPAMSETVPPQETKAPMPEPQEEAVPQAVPEEQKVTPEEEPQREETLKETIEEKHEEKPLIDFLKIKNKLFTKQAVELSFLQANSYLFYSKGTEGSYLFYHSSNGCHYYVCFSTPEGESLEVYEVYEVIPELRAYFKSRLTGRVNPKELCTGYNDHCRERGLQVDLTFVQINESEKSVAYTSCGSAFALYLKHDEQDIKELTLEVPQLGSISKDEFSDKMMSADIRFKTDDIFLLLPPHASDIHIGSDSYVDIIKKNIFRDRGLSAQTMGMEVVSLIEAASSEEEGIPETGFVALKFL